MLLLDILESYARSPFLATDASNFLDSPGRACQGQIVILCFKLFKLPVCFSLMEVLICEKNLVLMGLVI